MAYKCLNCGHIFEDGEQRIWTESHGEKIKGCPICLGEYRKTKECNICGSEQLEEDLIGSVVCEECISACKYDAELCYVIAKSAEKTEVELNSFLTSILDPEDMENILIWYLKRIYNKVDCSPFIDQDKDWFAEELIKRVGRWKYDIGGKN